MFTKQELVEQGGMVIYCINPLCEQRQNPDEAERCLSCGTTLLINERIHLLKPLRELTENPFSRNEIFEVDDLGTEWNPVRKRRVMKILKWSSPEFVRLLERESLALQSIQHPNIPESNTLDDLFSVVLNNSPLTLHCLVMDKFDGQNLEEWIKENEPISQPLALEWLQQLVEILDVVHHTEFFHRDIKPANIILQPNGQLALIDFGTVRRVTDTYLAKVSGSGGTETRPGSYEITSVVSHYYTPLEQVHGKAVPQSDFYALGRSFVRLVTGNPLTRLPTDQKTGSLIWRKHAPQIDKPFADFLDELMAPVPGQRPATTKIILERLQKLPFQSKLNRIIKSKLFLIAIFILGLSSTFGLYMASKPLIGNYFFTEGKKAQKDNRVLEAQSNFQKAIEYNYSLKYSISGFYLEQASRHIDEPLVAKKYYESAIKFNPNDANAYQNLALICQNLVDLECVTRTYTQIWKLQPQKWESHHRLGEFYDNIVKYDLAEEQYTLAIKLSNQAIPSLNNLSRIKNIDGNYTEAISLINQGLRGTKNPQWQAVLYKNLGWAKLGLKEYNSAKTFLEKSKNLDPKRTETYCLLAQAQEALGEVKDAKLSWEVCMFIKSDLPEVIGWRQQILQRLFEKE